MYTSIPRTFLLLVSCRSIFPCGFALIDGFIILFSFLFFYVQKDIFIASFGNNRFLFFLLAIQEQIRTPQPLIRLAIDFLFFCFLFTLVLSAKRVLVNGFSSVFKAVSHK